MIIVHKLRDNQTPQVCLENVTPQSRSMVDLVFYQLKRGYTQKPEEVAIFVPIIAKGAK